MLVPKCSQGEYINSTHIHPRSGLKLLCRDCKAPLSLTAPQKPCTTCTELSTGFQPDMLTLFGLPQMLPDLFSVFIIVWFYFNHSKGWFGVNYFGLNLCEIMQQWTRCIFNFIYLHSRIIWLLGFKFPTCYSGDMNQGLYVIMYLTTIPLHCMHVC